MWALKRFSEVQNLPVYYIDGTFLGTLENILVDQDGNTLGFRIDRKGLFLRDNFLPLSAFYTIDEQKMIVSKKELLPVPPKKNSYQQVIDQNGMIGKQIRLSNGELKGLTEEVFFYPNLDKIETIELSEGWFTDITEGRTYVNYSDLTVTDDSHFTYEDP